jgi:putative component of membrane protein insertase Oxa1/YidC/SpoIIIJ protein YidD
MHSEDLNCNYGPKTCSNYIFGAIETFFYAGGKSMGGCWPPVLRLLQESGIAPLIRLLTLVTSNDVAHCQDNYISE